ncbi:hypothetical protein EBZ80_09685 [bacterium]|nr:hypothetical protein [bacterium]
MDDKRDMSAAQLARILREARANGAPLAQVIERGLAAIAGRKKSSVARESAKQGGEQTITSKVEAHSAAPGNQDAAQLRKMLAALIHSGAKWPQLQSVAWKLFMLAPADVSAAHFLELCALHGTRQELLDLAGSLRDARHTFYFHLHPSVRERLALIAWSAGRFELVAETLVRARDGAQLLPAERLVVFLFLAKGSDPAPAFMYFRAHRAGILDAAKNSPGLSGVNHDEVVLKAGRLALDLGFDFDVRELVRLVPQGSDRHSEAVELLNQTVKETPNSISDPIEVQIVEGTWQQRLEHLENRLASARRLASSRDPGRARLNEVLKNILSFIPQVPEAWAQLSESIVLNRDLAGVMPALYSPFQANALVFHPAPLDAALWQGPLKIRGDASHLLDSWWHGVAMLHQYIAHGSGHEETLWKARRMILDVSSSAEFALPFRWSDLLRAAMTHVSRHAPGIWGTGDEERRVVMAQLTIAGDPDSFSAHDIEDYLRSSWRTPLVVLSELERIAIQKKAPDAQRLAILKKATVAGLTNNDLDAIWRAASAAQNDDLCWRVAAVASTRSALIPSARHALEISGERRGFYPFMAPTLEEIEKTALAGFLPREAQMARALLRVGPRLPELFSLFDGRSRVLKPVSAPAGSPEASIELALKALKWLPPGARAFRFSHEQAAFGGVSLPPFLQMAPASPWGLLFVLLGQRLGCNAWNWQFSRLANTVSELIPRVAHIPEYKSQTSKVARWLRDLSAEERIAWQELGKECRSFTDQEGHDFLGKLASRLSLMMLPDNIQALQSLQQMRVELPVLRDLEAWILGQEYSQWRQQRGLASRIMVPLNLRRLDAISKI